MEEAFNGRRMVGLLVMFLGRLDDSVRSEMVGLGKTERSSGVSPRSRVGQRSDDVLDFFSLLLCFDFLLSFSLNGYHCMSEWSGEDGLEDLRRVADDDRRGGVVNASLKRSSDVVVGHRSG